MYSSNIKDKIRKTLDEKIEMYPKSKCTWCRIVCHYQIFSLIFWFFLGYFGLLTYLCTRDYVHLSSDLQRELSETGMHYGSGQRTITYFVSFENVTKSK